jgi:predicted O-methyltransferase YrrM
MANGLPALPTSAFDVSLIATHYRSAEIQSFFRKLNDDISMLHPDVLALLYHMGKHARGPVLELGPYVGGSTIALAKGLIDGGRDFRITSVEMGGSYDHPTYATSDIVASLRANLDRYGVAGRVRVIVGHSRDEPVIRQVKALESRYACLLIDTDGHVAEDIRIYRPVLEPDSLLVVDDYYAPGAPDKEATTRTQLDSLVQAGQVVPYGVHGWGTWLGRFG